MTVFLLLSFLFFIGSVSGWFLELFYRHLMNPELKWVNPGFCTGPWLPLYGFGLCLIYLLAEIPLPGMDVPLLRVLLMGAGATVLEYLAGLFCLKYYHVRLWDYRDRPLNLQGLVCPLFSLFWTLLSALYLHLVHPLMLHAVDWLGNNLVYSFGVGLFFGVFLVDVARSAEIIGKLKRYAEENEVIVRFETIKLQIRAHALKHRHEYRFFRPFRSQLHLNEHLRGLKNEFERLKK